ncbi:hypothetical protein Patl1_08260 [Pistacia atlantica]|uniref:Uncharacterized protein n=1 Tax=Pistacia atlantica TaxID=434234 RepID=A0ACC1AK03_9ROSI|nr:hypothetical protein Patl1_08260 [Pistacia atlantica]
MKISKTETVSDSGGKVNEEEHDYNNDLRLARRLKRRRIASENFRLTCGSYKASKQTINSDIKNNKNKGSVAEVVLLDSDYEGFLNDMAQEVDVDSDAGCADNVNGVDKDDVGEVLDPHYMIFLENLKEDGKSFVLELALGNGTSIVVRYEEENDSRNGLGVENLEDHQSEQNIETENILRSQLDKENNENPRVLRSNLARQMTESRGTVLRSNSRWRKTESRRQNLRGTSGREANGSASILNDVVEREKTQRSRTLRSNPRREDNGNVSILNVVKKEKTESPRTLRNNLRRENNKTRTILHGVVKREKVENSRPRRNVSRGEDRKTQNGLRDVETIDKKSLMAMENVKTETKGHVSCSANDFSGKRCRSNFVDKSYLQFANSLMKDGQNFLCTPEGGNKMAKDGDEGSSSDSEVIILDNDPILNGKSTPFESSKFCAPCVVIDDEGIMECHGSKQSQFRETLMAKLQMPFDNKECDALFRDASQRKPKQGARELRGRTVVFPADSDMPSYLELHDSLAKKVNQAGRDRRKILNLLRGFFYWLKNLSKEGAFLPWMDSQCLSTLPPV